MKKIQIYIDRLLYTLMITLFVIMLGVTTLNVFMRFVLNNPIVSAVELGRYCFVAIIYVGAIYVMRDDGHIGLDIFVEKLPIKAKKLVIIIGKILVQIFLIVFAYCSIKMVKNGFVVKSSSLGIPMAIPYFSMVIGSIGMIIENTLNLVNSSRLKCNSTEEDLK